MEDMYKRQGQARKIFFFHRRKNEAQGNFISNQGNGKFKPEHHFIFYVDRNFKIWQFPIQAVSQGKPNNCEGKLPFREVSQLIHKKGKMASHNFTPSNELRNSGYQ